MIGPGGSGVGYSGSSTSSITTSATTTQGTGSTFLICAYYASSGAITSITDTFGNTYVAATPEVANPSDGGFFQVYECQNGAGGASHTSTVHLSPTQVGLVFFVEIVGGVTASILDTQNAVYDNGGSPFPCSVTTTNPIDLLVGFIVSASQSLTESFSSPLLTTSILQINQSTTTFAAGAALSTRVTSENTYNAAISDSAGYSKALVAMLALKEAGSSSGNTAGAVPSFGPGVSPDIRTVFTARPLSAYVTPNTLGGGRASWQGIGRGVLAGTINAQIVGWVPQAGPGISPDYTKTFVRPALSTALPAFTSIRGVALWSAHALGGIGAQGALAGAALWQGLPSQATLTGAASLSGVANWEGQGTAFLSTGSVSNITGVALWAAHAVAVLTGSAALRGVVNAEAQSRGGLIAAGALSGEAIWQGYGYGSANGMGALEGAITWQAHSSGFLSGSAQLSGRASAQGLTVAPLTGAAALSGIASGSAYPLASMTGSGALKGVSLGQGSGYAAMLGAAALEGVTLGQAQALGLLLPVGAGQMQGLSYSAGFTHGFANTSSFQFGWAVCTAQSQNGLPVARACYIEESACIIEIQCFTPTSQPFVPNAISYRIDDVVSGAEILDWTAMNPGIFMEIVVTSAQNAMISNTRCSEAHQVLFRITDGFGNVSYARVEFDLIRVRGL